MNPGRAAVAALALITITACSDPSPPQPDAKSFERIVTLAPNLTELAFTAGAGGSVIGVSAWSDFPPVAKRLPVIGDAFMIDEEQLALMQPDLLLAWEGGTPAHVIDELRSAGFHVEVLRTDSIDDVAASLRRIGELAGSEAVSDPIAAEFTSAIRNMAEVHRDKPGLRVFYQVSRRPLYTISGQHYVSELIDICGGSNIFADLEELAPTVDVEAVLDRDPEVLLASTDGGEAAFADWERWPDLAANRYGNHFQVPADTVSRATTRLISAAGSVCAALDHARANRGAADAA